MKQITLPDYKDLSRVLSKTKLKLNPSQVQGLMCGLLCGNPQQNNDWEELATGEKVTGKTYEMLKVLHDTNAQQLQDFLFDFQLVLPSDDDPLPQRAEALTLWTQGFLTGLKLGGIQIVDREANEVTEAINDLIEIAKMNYEDVVSSEEDEQAYVELVEYVRMAIILIYQELRETESSNISTSSNHLH